MIANSNLPFSDKTSYIIDPKLPTLLLTELTKQVKELPFHSSKIMSDNNTLIDSSNRTSTQSWLCWDTWVAGIMHNMFISANNDYFNYDLDHFDSGIQATKYEPNQYFGWHVDHGMSIEGKLPRKLSMSFVLDTEFEGGELEIQNPATNKIDTFDIPTGNVVIFPAWVSHRVKPVTSGTRYSLVSWMNGPQFR